jgi:uncharacterized protein (TIGR00369 family)
MDAAAALALVRRVTESPGYTHEMGTRVLAAEPGQADMAIDSRPGVLQAHGYFHGGVIAGLADHAAGRAVTTALPPGRFAVTVNLQVSYLAPAEGETLIARARAVQTGQAICVAQVEVSVLTGGTELRCALATVTLRSVELPGSLVRP